MKKSKRKGSSDLVCVKCLKDLEANQLFCTDCGEPTRKLTEDLSAKRNWQQAWADYKNRKGENYPFAIFFFFLVLLPTLYVAFFVTDSYYISNLFFLIFLPLVFIPFTIPVVKENTAITIKRYIHNLRYYPRVFLFVLINVLYFFLLKIITSSVDPILNLVRLILVLYWLAIMVPYLHLLLRKEVNPFKALLIVYKGGKETRWQQFFTYFYLFVINLAGLAALGVGLLVTIPYSIAVIERYYMQMDKLGLLKNE